MKRGALILLLALLMSAVMPASAQDARFSFGVLASGRVDDDALRNMLDRTAAANFAFVVAFGIRPPDAPCKDVAYQRRRHLFERSQHGLMPVPAGADWAACAGIDDPTDALARLTRIRELLFQGEFSFGATRLPLVRQSTEARFHNFTENMRWEIGNVMFATMNLPAPNNHFVMAAGRNGEFEDRLVANRAWLHRLFTQARLQDARAVVLFCEANPMARPAGARRDGFAEMRRYLRGHANEFKGKVLIVHAQPTSGAAPTITWQGNLGEIGLGRGWFGLRVDTGAAQMIVPLKRAERNQ